MAGPGSPAERPSGASRSQKVWDAPTRLFHWLLVGLVCLSWWSAEEHEMQIHLWSGYLIIGLLVFRIYWGFMGPETARFARFLKGPVTTFGYLGRLFRPDYKLSFGHNPLGALSVVAILLALLAQVGLGLFATDTDGLWSGPLSRFVDYDTAYEMAELHESAFNILLALIGLHIAAIVFYLVVKRANLVGPMITGRRKVGETGPEGGIAAVPLWRLALGLALSAGVVWYLWTM